MPWYDVRCQEVYVRGRGICCRHPPGTKHCQPSPASRKRHGIVCQGGQEQMGYKGSNALWRDRWRMAMKAMPYRVRQKLAPSDRNIAQGQDHQLPTSIKAAARGSNAPQGCEGCKNRSKACTQPTEWAELQHWQSCWVISRRTDKIIRRRANSHAMIGRKLLEASRPRPKGTGNAHHDPQHDQGSDQNHAGQEAEGDEPTIKSPPKRIYEPMTKRPQAVHSDAG